MKRKIVSAVALAVVSLALLFLAAAPAGQGPGPSDYAYYFRDNTEFAGTSTLMCYAELPYADDRGFGDQRQRLEDCGAIPEMPEYGSFSCTACYNADGSFFEISMTWQDAPEGPSGYKQLSLLIIPGDMGDPEKRDGVFLPDGEQVTVTEVDGVTVYGSGTVEPVQIGERAIQNNMLVFTRDDVRYQIGVGIGSTLEEMGRVLDFYLQHGLDLDSFSIELGDDFTHASLEDNPDAFPGCIPDLSDIPTENGATYILKNGELYSYEVAVYGGGAQFYWCVKQADGDTESAGTVEDITEAAFREALVQDVLGTWRVTLRQGPWAVELVCYEEAPPVDFMWELVKSLK